MSSSNPLPVPRTSEEITSSWLCSILKIPESDITSFTKSPNSFSNSGNLSSIVRVQFQFANKDEITPPLHNYIIKLLPTDKEILDAFYSDKFDQKEIFFYKQLLPELLQELPELEEYICPFIHGEVQQADPSTGTLYSSVLVLKDLQPLHYTMPTFDVGLSSQEIQQCIDFAVKLNVAGISLRRKYGGISLSEIYSLLNDWRLPIEDASQKYKNLSWFPSGLVEIDKLLGENPKSTPEMRTAFRELIPFADKILYLIFEAGQKFPTIVHDDLWPHNFLLPPEKSKLSIKVIDWQMVGCTDATYDLAHFLFSSLQQRDVNRDKLYELVTNFYEQYAASCAEHNLNVGRTKEEFMQYFFTYAISYCVIWFAMSCDSIYGNIKYRGKLFTIVELFYILKAPQFIMSLVQK